MGIEDMDEPCVTCEMCEWKVIRYVHYMQHPDYPEILGCGCICAGYMEGSLDRATARDATMKSRAGKRKRWLTRRWRTSNKGNEWLKAYGYRVTIFLRSSGWASCVNDGLTDVPYFSRKDYPTEDEAKLAAFDLITHLESGHYTKDFKPGR